MNRSSYVLGLAVLAIGTTLCCADPVDPVFSMDDPAPNTPVTSNTFVFAANSLGGGVLSFINQSGTLWNDLVITVTEPDNTVISVLPGLFFNSTVYSSKDLGNGFTTYGIGLYNTGAGSGGIGINTSFSINLNDLVKNVQNPDPGGAGGWGAGASFAASANTLPGDPFNTPEPASMLLLALGSALVWGGSRRFRRASL